MVYDARLELITWNCGSGVQIVSWMINKDTCLWNNDGISDIRLQSVGTLNQWLYCQSIAFYWCLRHQSRLSGKFYARSIERLSQLNIID